MNRSGKDQKVRRGRSAPTVLRVSAPRDPVRTDLKAYLDGELPALHAWRVRWHLARCSECHEEVTWLRRLGEDMLDLEKAVPRPELRARILASLPPPEHVVVGPRSWERAPRVARIGLPRLAFGSAALIFALGGVFAMTHHQRSSPHPTSSPLQTAMAGQSHSLLPAKNNPQKPFVAGTTQVTPSVRPGEVPSLPPGNLPQMPHSNRDPFRPADVPSAPQAIVHNGQDGTGTGSSDGTYADAVKLYKQYKAVQVAEAHRRDQMILQQANRRPVEGKLPQRSAHTAPIRLAMTVANVSATRTLLQALVRQMDGTAIVPPAGVPHASPGQGVKATTSLEPAENIVTLRVPAQHVEALLHDLEQLGTLRQDRPTQPDKLLSNDPADYRLQPSTRTTGQIKAQRQRFLEDPSTPSVSGKGPEVSLPQMSQQPGMPMQTRPDQDGSASYITIMLRLQSVPPISH